MTKRFNVGDKVERECGSGTASEKAEEVFDRKVMRTIEGTEVTRNASEDAPAHPVRQDHRDRALNSRSDLAAA